MNFLIIVYKGIGDVVLTTPLVRVIKKKIENSRVYFLTKKYSSNILSNNPYIDGVLIKEDLKIKDLRTLKIDVSIDYMLSSSSAFYSVMSGAKKRIAFYRKWGFLLYNTMIKTDFNGYNAIKKFEYLKPFGIKKEDITDFKPEVYPSKSDFDKVINKLVNINIKKEKIISLDITSPRVYRQLSGDKFIYIADKLIEKGFKTVFAPSSFEYDYVCDTINKFSKYKSMHMVIDNLSLMELSALISLAKLHIGTSSAPMHIAVALGIPTFTIYSSYTDPVVWTPPWGNNRYVFGELEKLSELQIYEKISFFIDELKIL
jgi:ADP-heptose:LPS heptosyltransferase